MRERFRYRAPRSRGASRVQPISLTAMSMCSPLRRGFKEAETPGLSSRMVLPAHAGLQGSCQKTQQQLGCAPRSRGASRALMPVIVQLIGCSPLTRGFKDSQAWTGAAHGVLPARAGLQGNHWTPSTKHCGTPRSRGASRSRQVWTYLRRACSALGAGLQGSCHKRSPRHACAPRSRGASRSR